MILQGNMLDVEVTLTSPRMEISAYAVSESLACDVDLVLNGVTITRWKFREGGFEIYCLDGNGEMVLDYARLRMPIINYYDKHTGRIGKNTIVLNFHDDGIDFEHMELWVRQLD